MKSLLFALEQKGSIQFLFLLDEKKKINVSDGLDVLKKNKTCGQSAYYTAIKKLEDADLISEESTGFPGPRIFTLTDKGKAVVGKLKEI